MQTGIRRLWAATAHLVVGLPAATVTGSLVGTTAIYALLAKSHGAGAHGRSALFAVSRACSLLQQSRYAGLLGVELTLAPAGRRQTAWRGFWYHMVIGFLVSLLGFVSVVGLWTAAAVSVLLMVSSIFGSSFFGLRVGDPLMWAACVTVAVGSAWVAIRATPGLAQLDVHVARAMLEVNRADELLQRVEVLTESRADVVDAADAERRRIERDLHDGVQQRLVALAMNLGMARANLTDVDERAREAIAHAHDEAKQALTELRELVRGLHPAVLDNRGLDAALSGIAASSPVPATLTVDVPLRPSPTIEAVAYFVVSEALSNVAKHAQASSASISVRRRDSLLHIEIRDDGRGGADPSGGTGLRGLAQRVSSVDGKLHVQSPIGGPTVISVELPCES